jgi:hypothetical protein
MSRTPQDEQGIRVMRSLLMIVILTSGSVYSIDGRAFPPHGNPLVYSIAISWLISMTIAVLSSAIFFRVNPTLFSNANFRLRVSRADCDRLLREMNSSEGVHWLTCVVSIMLAISYLLHNHAVYGYVMLLVRIPFDLYPIMLQRWNRGRVWRALGRPRIPAGEVLRFWRPDQFTQ